MKGKNFAERFTALRKKAKLTQAQLASELGVVAKYVGMIETGTKEVDPEGSLAKLFERVESDYDRASEHIEIDMRSEDGRTALYRLRPELSPREKLRATMAARGITPRQLAKLTKYNAPLWEEVLNGSTRMSEGMHKALVREFPELQDEDLLGGSDTPRVMDASGAKATLGSTPPFQLPGKNKTRYVPLVSWAAAGRLDEIDATDEAYEHEGVMTNVPGEAFAVTIQGDSMYPEINPGDLAIVRRDAEPRVGGLVLVKTIHGDVLCKRYQTRDGGKLVILSSVNRSYEPIEIPPSEIAFIYPIKQVQRNY